MSSTNNGGGHSYGRGVSTKSIPTPSPSDTIMETHEYMRRHSSASQEKTESRYNRNRTNNTNDTNSSDELNPFPASRRRNAGRISRVSRVSSALTNSLTKARKTFATPGIFVRRSNTASSAGSIASHNTPINNNSDVDYYSPIDSPNNNNNNSPNNTNNTWDLDYCISIIESLQTAPDNNVALTPLQVDAICHLRSASSASASKNNPIRTGAGSGRDSTRSRGSIGSMRSRRNAHLLKDGDAALLTKELFKCFQEVEKEGSKDEQVRIFILCVRSFGGGYVNF